MLLCFCVDRAEILEEERHAGVTGHAGGRPSGWKTINLVRNSGVIVIISNLIMMLRVAGAWDTSSSFYYHKTQQSRFFVWARAYAFNASSGFIRPFLLWCENEDSYLDTGIVK